MKTWMKILMWFCLGSGIGFCAGLRVGENRGRAEAEQYYDPDEDDQIENIREELDEYRGDIHTVKGIDEILRETATDEEEPEMPTEADLVIDPDIPQLHPTHFVPEIISEEEFNLNPWQFDIENLIFYEMDEVLYNESKQEPIQVPEDLIGIGTLFEFNGNPNNPVETIYVKNDTYGKIFRIDKLDAAFCDAVDGSFPPEDDAPEEEEDDYWNDV